MSLTARTLLALAALIPAEPPKAQPQRAKWEYKEVDWPVRPTEMINDRDPKKRVEAMNKLGEDGWECVGVAYIGDGNRSPCRTYYRQPTDPAVRKKWEYTVTDSRFGPIPLFEPGPASDIDQLKKLAEDGWELASIIQDGYSSNHKCLFLLKRAK